MSLLRIDRALPENQTPYFHFPENGIRNVIEVDKFKAYEYITPENLDRAIRLFSEQIRLRDFDVLCINQKGGGFFADKLIKLQEYKGAITHIEYHENGRITTPIPKDILKLKIAILDDVLDKFITGGMIQKDAPNAQLLYMTKKRDVTPPHTLHNCQWAAEVDNVWLLGAGMNGDSEDDGYPKNWGRKYPGIAVKIQQ